jgi:hypothetical protein
MQTHIGVLLFTQEIIIYTGNYFLRIIIYVRWEEKAQVRQTDTYLYTCRHT